MDQLIKQFTLIDFLGILAPGATAVLATNYYLFDVTVPIVCLSADSDFLLILYFLGLSYLCGNLLQQIGGYLESRLSKCGCLGESMHEKHWQGDTIRTLYLENFDIAPLDTPDQRLEAGKQIYHYIQSDIRPGRVVLFHAFSSMSRALVIDLIGICILSVCTFPSHPFETFLTVVVCALLTIAFYARWRDYEQRCIDAAYMCFLSQGKKSNHP